MSEIEATGTNGQTTPGKKPAKAKAPKKAAARKRTVVAVKVSDITIDTSVPIPEVSKDKGKYPFLTLKPGHSFLVKCPKNKTKAMVANIRSASRRVTAKTKAEFLVVARPEEGGVRCWRTDGHTEKGPIDRSLVVEEPKLTPSGPDLSAFSGPKPE